MWIQILRKSNEKWIQFLFSSKKAGTNAPMADPNKDHQTQQHAICTSWDLLVLPAYTACMPDMPMQLDQKSLRRVHALCKFSKINKNKWLGKQSDPGQVLKRQQSDVTATRPAVKAIFAWQAAFNTVLVKATIEAPMFTAKASKKVSRTKWQASVKGTKSRIRIVHVGLLRAKD